MLHAHAAICKEKVFLNRRQRPLIYGSHILKLPEAVKFPSRNSSDSLLGISKRDGRNCPGKQFHRLYNQECHQKRENIIRALLSL